jgi:PAS domain S-box-containing protein
MKMVDKSVVNLLQKIKELEDRLGESEQLIEAIRTGEVDAFAIRSNEGSEIYTLQGQDYAYRLLIEEFAEGALNVTEDGLIVYTNPGFYHLVNLPYDQVIGSSVFDFIHHESEKEFRRLFKDALAGRSKGEINMSSKDRIIPVYISLTSLQPRLGTIGIIVTDFSEKKRNEKIILDYQKDLELKNQKLTQSNAELDSFAYIASHDLQEPLRKIQTFATRLLEKEYERLSESGRDHFNRMQRSARQMQTLIEDLLSYSRTNAVERKFENTDIKKLVKEVQSSLREELQQRKATIETDCMGHAWVIPFQFRQLLNNLMSNSLKFSSPDKPPHIKIKSEIVEGSKLKDKKVDPEQNYYRLTVSDNGIGFEPQYHDRIFELFQRLHSRSEFNGTGIGLAIVKKIVDNHNGTITATASLDKGAVFDIYIPASRSQIDQARA